MVNQCSFVLNSYRRTVFYTFSTNEVDVEEIVKMLYNFILGAMDKHGDAILHVVDAIEPLIDEAFPNFIKTNNIPAGTDYTFILKCNQNRIHTLKNNPTLEENVTNIDHLWDAKIIMLTTIKT